MAEQINQDITIPDEPPSSRDKVNFRLRADAFVAWMKVFATQMNSLIPKVNASLSWINTNVQNALSYSQTATAQAGVATTKAGEASASAAAALASKEAAEAIFDNFDDKYLGAKPTAPIVDNDGNPLTTGALYFKTTAPKGIYVYDAELSIWSSPTYVPTSHGALSGLADADAHPMSAITGLTDKLQSLDNKVILSGVAAYHIYNGKLSLANSVITNGFSTTLYTGNGSTQSVNTGVDMATQWGNDASETFGGLVWLKSRSNGQSNILQDTIRGGTTAIYSDLTAADTTTGSTTVYNNNGFTLGAYGNSNLATYASWNFQTTHRKSSCDGASELITNGNFDTNLNGWTVGAGISAQWVAGKAEITWLNTTSTYCMYQAIPTTVGKKYTVKVTSSQSSEAENIYIKVGNSASDGTIVYLIQPIGKDHLVTFTATETTTYLSLFFGQNIGDKGYIDNVSVKECIYPTNHGKYWECHYNPFTGFTSIKYEGSGIAGHEIPHNLGRKLDFVGVKNLSAVADWVVNTSVSMGLQLNSNIAQSSGNNIFDITSNQWSDGDNVKIGFNYASFNASSNQYIMYGWANSYYDEASTLIGNFEIGTYTGTGVAGNKVKTKGKPAWILSKRLDSAGNWWIGDNQRDGGSDLLVPNLSNVEANNATNSIFTYESDGFTVNTTSIDGNTAGGQYLYMVVYDNDSGSGKSKYPRATDSSTLNLSAHVPFANGIDTTGTKVSLAYKNETITLSNSLTQGKNYIASLSDGTYVASPYAPMYLMRDRAKAGENPDYFDVSKQKWFATTGGSALYENNGDNITGWWKYTSGATTLTTDGSMLSTTWDNTASLYTNYLLTGLSVGKTYIAKVNVSSVSGEGHIIIGNASLYGTFNFHDGAAYGIGNSISSGTSGTSIVRFVANDTSAAMGLRSNGASGNIKWDSISVFEATPIVGAEITSRNYLDCIVYADQNGQPTYVEQIEKATYFDVVKANEYKGKNACTAWVVFDGTTTPPTIKDSFNVKAIIRTATGIFDIYFTENMDSINYAISGSCNYSFDDTDNGAVCALMLGRTKSANTIGKCRVITSYDGTLLNSPFTSVKIFGGKN